MTIINDINDKKNYIYSYIHIVYCTLYKYRLQWHDSGVSEISPDIPSELSPHDVLAQVWHHECSDRA